MLDFLERLRAKPEKTRKHIAAAATGTIILIIFAFWLTATIWKIENPPAAATSTIAALSSSVSNMIQSAQNNAPAVSF